MSEPNAEIPYSAELERKALHLLSLSLPLGAWYAGRTVALAVLIPIALAAVTADYLRVRHRPFRRWIRRHFASMMRPEEWPALGGRIELNGATWVVVSLTLLLILFPLAPALAAFIAFMLADAAAAIVGRRLGRHHWPGTRRTVEGSAAFVVTSAAILFLLDAISPVALGSPLALLSAALLGSAAEALPRPLNDNLRVPVVMAFTLWLLASVV